MAASACAQTPRGSEAQPSFRAGTRVVEVVVAATGSGNRPVTNLRAEDLKIFDNSLEQKMASFERIEAPARTDGSSATRTTTPQGRQSYPLTFILLDALNTSFGDQIYGRQGVSQMLSGLPPGERIALFASGDALHLLHNFSADYESLRAIIEKYEGEQPANWKPDMHNESVRLLSVMAASDERKRIFDTLRALTTLAETASRHPGPKKLLWISSSFPTEFKSLVGGSIAAEDFHRDAALVMRKLAAAEVTLYPVNPQGLKPTNSDALAEMAEQTGGRELALSNDVAALVRQAMDEPRDAYLLTFVPSDYADDGAFHEIRLKTKRKNIDLRYRTAYAADPPAR